LIRVLTLTSLALFLSFSGLPTPAKAQQTQVGSAIAAPLPEYLETFRTRLEQAASDNRMVGLVAAVIQDGEPVLVFSHGEAVAGQGEAVTPQTLFRAASVSKTFTGTLLAMLEEDGVIDLDDDMPTDVLTLDGTRPPTLLEVASHRTGLPPNAYDNDLEAGQSVQRIRQRLSGVDLICPVGDCYSYQNVAFSTVETLVERATGQGFDDVVSQRIFADFDFPRASLGVPDLQAADAWARPHRGWRRTGNTAGNPRTNYDRLPSAAGVNVSLEDMIVWAQLQLGSRPGLSPDVRDRAHSRFTNTVRETRRLGDLRQRIDSTWYGLGWRIYDWGDRTIVMHSGYLSGYGAQIVLEPETGFGFVALWNSDNRSAWWLWPTLMDLHTGDGEGNWLDSVSLD